MPFDREHADRLLETYLGPNRDEWTDMFFDLPPEGYPLIRFGPETGGCARTVVSGAARCEGGSEMSFLVDMRDH